MADKRNTSRSISGFVLLLTFASLQSFAQTPYPFHNPKLPEEQRIDNLLSLMTLQEKIDLLGTSLNVPRLGIHGSGEAPTIPGSGGQFEGIHGLAVGGPGNWGRKSPGEPGGEFGGTSTIPTTQFPQAAGLGETWDPTLLRSIASEEGDEARYIFQSYDRGGLIIRAPNADLARDPRWGRSEESYGEDPFLVGTLATAFTEGLQGDDPHYWRTVSLVKHFMANSNEDTRDSSSSNFDAALLHEYYAAPFRVAIEQGHAGGLMASYNAVNGIPMTANPLLQSLVVGQWGFRGILDTDRGAVTFMVTKHKYYPDLDHAVAGAIHAGINQFLDAYQPAIQDALQKKLISESDIDTNLRGLIHDLIKLGLLDPANDNPYSRIKTETVPPWETQKTKDLALRATRESIVLLKNAAAPNSQPLLPLDRSGINSRTDSKVKSIAVIGPRADEVDSDGYGGTPPFAITPLQGITAQAGDGITVRYAPGTDSPVALANAVALAKASDIAIVVVGNQPACASSFGHCTDPTEGKEAVDRQQIHLQTQQEQLLEAVVAANPHTIMVLVSSFPFTIDWAQDHVPAIVHMAHSSEEEGKALADVLFGAYDPAGRLSVTWPRSIEQLPAMMDYNLSDGRTYMYFKQKPLYPFGFGLSYTTFQYSDMRLSSATLPERGEVNVSVSVTNAGKRQGDEIVQMYVQHLDSKVDRPLEELKGFQRISLAGGETKVLSFNLPATMLAYWNIAANRWEIEHDRVRVMLGSSSTDIKTEKTLSVTR